MKCTNKEQETCEVEKRTCEGCYYNDETIIYDECDEEEIKELLIGHKVKVIKKDGQEATLELDNGVRLEVLANEGCGGCSSGWYSINKLKKTIEMILHIKYLYSAKIQELIY